MVLSLLPSVRTQGWSWGIVGVGRTTADAVDEQQTCQVHELSLSS